MCKDMPSEEGKNGSFQFPANNFLTSAPHFQREDVALFKGEREMEWGRTGRGDFHKAWKAHACVEDKQTDFRCTGFFWKAVMVTQKKWPEMTNKTSYWSYENVFHVSRWPFYWYFGFARVAPLLYMFTSLFFMKTVSHLLLKPYRATKLIFGEKKRL